MLALEDSKKEHHLSVQRGVSRRATPEPALGEEGLVEAPRGRWRGMGGEASQALWCSAHLQLVAWERTGINKWVGEGIVEEAGFQDWCHIIRHESVPSAGTLTDLQHCRSSLLSPPPPLPPPCPPRLQQVFQSTEHILDALLDSGNSGLNERGSGPLPSRGSCASALPLFFGR